MTDLHVAIYRRAEEGKLRHWAIWLQTFPPEESVILQVTDNMYGYGYCIDDPIYASPFHTEKIESVIYCGSICRENHDRACTIEGLRGIASHGFWSAGICWSEWDS
nr:hypothetical protein FAC5L9_25 [Penicillium camemberti]